MKMWMGGATKRCGPEPLYLNDCIKSADLVTDKRCGCSMPLTSGPTAPDRSLPGAIPEPSRSSSPDLLDSNTHILQLNRILKIQYFHSWLLLSNSASLNRFFIHFFVILSFFSKKANSKDKAFSFSYSFHLFPFSISFFLCSMIFPHQFNRIDSKFTQFLCILLQIFHGFHWNLAKMK